MTINAYPLSWPAGWKRIAPQYRIRGKFNRSERQYGGNTTWLRRSDVTVTDGTARILAELQRLGVERQDVVISTNVRLRLDGLPRSGEAKPQDPGVAVYWTDNAEPKSRAARCMAIDRYDRVADNLAAVAATIEAMRAIGRHGGAEILNRAFTGFTALPDLTKRGWREVLELNGETSLERARENYRRLAAAKHPDKPGGSHDAMTELNAAWDQAQRELR